MAEIKLGKARRRDYGTHYDGHVVRDDGKLVDITYRKTKHRAGAKALYAFANGLTAGKGTMRLPAVIGAEKGYDTVTFDYSNRSLKGALDSNAQDLAAILASVEHDKKRTVGLSEGGRVATRALVLHPKQEASTFVAPAGYIHNNHLSWLRGMLVISGVGPEMAAMSLRHPRTSAHLLTSCLQNCLERPLGVVGEMNELRKGSEHHIIDALKHSPERPVLRFMYGENDGLLDAVRQAAGIVGLHLDDIKPYPGGHCDITTDPGIANYIYDHDELLIAQRGIATLPDAA